MAELIYSIDQVFGTYLSPGQMYNIPEYQRGYKWDSQKITELLVDVKGFETGGDEDLFYCLQNITLVPNSLSKGMLNVVDGQQRLTTITLLLTYLGEGDKVKNKIHYSVRESSNIFLQRVIANENSLVETILNSIDFDKFLVLMAGVEHDFDYQDIYFMYNSIRTIERWFKDNLDVKKEIFKEKILRNVKLIINRIDNTEEQELFMNLNTGRVHLDGSDLVRAILITRVAKQEMEEYDSSEVKDVVRLNERRVRIGWELDDINSWWKQSEIRSYFGNFTKLNTGVNETIIFNEETYPINLLYKLWVEIDDNDSEKVSIKKDIRLKYFETGNTRAIKLYNSIILLNRTLRDWYEDIEIYHFLGFLFAHSTTSFRVIWRRWTSNITRLEFKDYLKSEIRKITFGPEPKPEKNINTGINHWILKIRDYDADNPTNWFKTYELEKILILLDIIELSKVRDKGNPLPKLRSVFFKKNQEDKEHIYPGTPKALIELGDNRNAYSSLIEYITRLNENIELPDKKLIFSYSKEQWDALEDDNKTLALKNLEEEVHKKTPINSIGNLVLLHLTINRGFGNDYYQDKRSAVIENSERGLYVRQHTLKVFVKQKTKSLNNVAVDLNKWTLGDIKANASYIADTIEIFFKKAL